MLKLSEMPRNRTDRIRDWANPMAKFFTGPIKFPQEQRDEPFRHTRATPILSVTCVPRLGYSLRVVCIRAGYKDEHSA
jgi:hypothetical protein